MHPAFTGFFRQAEIDGKADQEAQQRPQQDPMPRLGHEQLHRQKTCERADHHRGRYRVARLRRIDHQVDHDIAECGNQQQPVNRGRIGQRDQ